MELYNLEIYTCFGIILAITIYWYLTHNYNYWSKRGVKGPKPVIGFGTKFYTFFKEEPLLELEWFNKFGKIYGLYHMTDPILKVGEPELIKHILVKDSHFFNTSALNYQKDDYHTENVFIGNGDHWKRIRSIMSQMFTPSMLKGQIAVMNNCVDNLLIELEKVDNNSVDIDLKHIFSILSMDIFARCFLGININAFKDDNNSFVVNANRLIHFNSKKTLLKRILPTFLFKAINNNSQEISARQFFYDLIKFIIKNNRSCDKNSILIKPFFKAFNNFIEIPNNNLEALGKDFNNEMKNIKYLTESEFMSQTLGMILGGYEDPTNTLSFVFYELALNDEIQDKLYTEVRDAIDSDCGVDYESISKLSYLDAIISETLRLYTTGIVINRFANCEYNLGTTGLKLFKGQKIEIPVYALHQSSEYFPNPTEFIPERFLPENQQNIVPYTYIPFGAGPRNCIGKGFALIEMKICVAKLIKRFRFVRIAQTEVPVKLIKKNFSFYSPKSITIGIENR